MGLRRKLQEQRSPLLSSRWLPLLLQMLVSFSPRIGSLERAELAVYSRFSPAFSLLAREVDFLRPQLRQREEEKRPSATVAAPRRWPCAQQMQPPPQQPLSPPLFSLLA